jgi:hypothetical protein
MAICARCNKTTHYSYSWYADKLYCSDCYEIVKLEGILKASENVHEAEDLQG